MRIESELKRVVERLRRLAAADGPAKPDLEAAIRAVEAALQRIERDVYPSPRKPGQFLGMVRPPVSMPPCS